MNIEKFNRLNAEQKAQAYAKIVDDRDVAMKVSESTTNKLEALARHLIVVDGCLKVRDQKLDQREKRMFAGILRFENND
jgi:hypothetical protein